MKNSLTCIALIGTLALATTARAQEEEDYRAQAVAAEKAGEFSRAADLFRLLIDAGSEDKEILMAATRCMEQASRFGDALDVLDEARAIFPDDLAFGVTMAKILVLKAEKQLAEGGQMDMYVASDYQEAAAIAEEVLEADSNNRDARLIAANSYFTVGEWDKARPHAEILVQESPDHPGGHIMLADLAFEQFKALTAAAAEEEEEEAKETTLRAQAALAVAEQSYSKALELDDQRIVAHRKLGDVYAWMGDTEKVLAKYRDALLIDPYAPVMHEWIASSVPPEDRFAYYEKVGKEYLERPNIDKRNAGLFAWHAAQALTAMSEFKRAEGFYEMVVELNPTFHSAYYYAMNSAWFFRSDEDAALDYAYKYAQNAPIEFADVVKSIPTEDDRKQVTQLVAYLAKRAMDKNYLSHCRDLNHVLAAIVDTADAWNNYAFMARDTQRYDESETAYRHALAIEPGSGQLMNDLAVILDIHRDNRVSALAEAKQLYEDALAIGQAQLAEEGLSDDDRAGAELTIKDSTDNLATLKRKYERLGIEWS